MGRWIVTINVEADSMEGAFEFANVACEMAGDGVTVTSYEVDRG
jgi:hypothetical protein